MTDEAVVVYSQLNWRHQTPIPLPPPVPYVGPGDVVSGATAWWGLRAYSDATKGGNAVRIRRISDNAEQDFVTLSNGSLDRASIVTFLTSTTGRIVTIYDQAGTNHQTNATASSQPVVNLSGLGSLVTGDWTAASSHSLVTGSAVSRSQPYTFGVVAKYINNATQSEIFAENTNLILMGYRSSTDNEVFIYGTGTATATASDAAFHALGAVYNGGSSIIYVDASSNAVSTGTAPLGAIAVLGGRGVLPFNGQLGEFGIWPAAFTGTQASDLSANQRAFWGF